MPPRPGDELELDVTTLAYGGQGVARADEFVMFVRGAVPGDRVRARVTRRKQEPRGGARHSRSSLLHRAGSPPRCRHADECGGCEWQTLSYAAQLEFKQQQVVESLHASAASAATTLEPIRGMDDPWRYRNKMEFSFGEAEDGGRSCSACTVAGRGKRSSTSTDCLLPRSA